MLENELIFSKIKEEAIIPTKRDEDAGYDLYPCFDEGFLVIPPLTTVLIPTGIATAMHKSKYAQIQERGSTGSKGIKYGAGVIDSGYRGEWHVPITNCNNKKIVIAKDDVNLEIDEDVILYSYSKAIAQFVILPVPQMQISTIPYDDLLRIESERGTGLLGSSNK